MAERAETSRRSLMAMDDDDDLGEGGGSQGSTGSVALRDVSAPLAALLPMVSVTCMGLDGVSAALQARLQEEAAAEAAALLAPQLAPLPDGGQLPPAAAGCWSSAPRRWRPQRWRPQPPRPPLAAAAAAAGC